VAATGGDREAIATRHELMRALIEVGTTRRAAPVVARHFVVVVGLRAAMCFVNP
jgi:hypothetical protein